MRTFRLIFTIIFLNTFSYCFSQDSDNLRINRNSLYFELFGNAGYLYNVTYDRLVLIREKNKMSVGLGCQYFNSSDIDDYIFSISPQISYLYGSKHHLETGLGIAYDFNSHDLVIPIRIGYRFQKLEGGFFCKLGFTPLLTNSYPFFGDGYVFLPWGGAAIGWSF